jgi:osmotically inducible protein OsmC
MRSGRGAISTESGALQAYPYGFTSRFDGQRGSNPEELVGAAHAACFSMALAMLLERAGQTGAHLETSAAVTLEQVPDGYAITTVLLTLRARVPGMSEADFLALAQAAKATCPVSKLLKATTTLDAALLP